MRSSPLGSQCGIIYSGELNKSAVAATRCRCLAGMGRRRPAGAMRDNLTEVTELTLSGLDRLAGHRVTVFAFTLLCYCIIWVLNVGVIAAVASDRSLHEPMYVLLCNLCANGLFGASGFFPKFLSDLLAASHVISYNGCLLQDFVLHSSACAQYSLLLLMALDRYVAICRPLVYRSLMSTRRVCALLALAWLTPFLLMSVSVLTTSTLRLCGSHIPKFFCTKYLMMKIACSAPRAHLATGVVNYTFYCAHIAAVVWSYMHLVRVCRASRQGRRKFMQTCLPHLVCLLTLVVCFLFDRLHMRLSSNQLPQGAVMFIEMEIFLVPPILHPLIYGLNVTKIRNRVKLFCFMKVQESRDHISPVGCVRCKKADLLA